MKTTFSERNLVIILFVLVFITFSLAQEDSKKMDQYSRNKNAEPKKPTVTALHLPLNSAVTREKESNLISPRD